MKTLFVFLSFICLLLPLHAVAKNGGIGIIKTVSGQADVISSNKITVQAIPNMKIYRGDTIRTGSAGTVGIIFDDDTSLALGPGSEIVVKEFLFEPAEHNLSFIARMVRGTFSFISGQITKLAPDKVQLETPEATLGVRGTTFAVEVK